MSDWELWAPTQAQLRDLFQQLVANGRIGGTVVRGPDGFVIEGFLQNGTRFSINYYKFKYLATGNILQGLMGSYPEMTLVAGVFAIMRWLNPNNNDPPQPSVASGVTLSPLPANSPIKFAPA